MLSPTLISTAIDLINTFGSTISFQTITNTYNTSSGKIEESIDTTDNIKASIENYSNEEMNGLVQSGDMKITIANSGLSFDNSTKIIFQSVTYNIISIRPTYLEDAVVIYEVQARR